MLPELQALLRQTPQERVPFAEAIARRRKKAVLTIRMNQQDLDRIKKKAKHYKIPYQTFISEILHRIAA